MYKKSYKKRYTPKRYYRRSATSKVAARTAAKVTKRLISKDVEVKHIEEQLDFVFNRNGANGTTGPYAFGFVNPSLPAQGTDYYQRVGSNIRLKSYQFKWRVQGQTVAGAPRTNVSFRIMAIMWNDELAVVGANSSPDAQAIFTYAADNSLQNINDLYSKLESKNYKVIYDRTYCTGNASEMDGVVKLFNFPGKSYEFSSAGTIVANKLVWTVIGTQPAAAFPTIQGDTFTATCRMNFVDA